MKNLLLILAVIAIGLAGCKKSDSKLIANKWTGVSLVYEDYNAAGVLQNSYTESIGTLVFDYKSDKTFTLNDGSGTNVNGTWSITDKSLTMIANNSSEIYTIKDLTTSKLVLINTEISNGEKSNKTLSFTR
jgi:hypothetical protein